MSSYIQVIDGEIHVVIPLNDQARIALNLTDEQVDTIWESSLV